MKARPSSPVHRADSETGLKEQGRTADVEKGEPAFLHNHAGGTKTY